MTEYHCGRLTWTMLRVLRKTGLLWHISFTLRTRIGGKRFIVPIRSGVGLYLLIRAEPWMDPLLRNLLDQFPGTFIDVGVNIGQTLCKVKALAPERAYVGFEPNPACALYTLELARLNKCANTRVVPIGLSQRAGLVQLELHTDLMDDSAATVVSDFRPGFNVYRSFTIPVVRFDTAAKELGIGTLGIVKVDVEGSERDVLLGMEERIMQDRPAVVLEILPVGKQTARLPMQQDVEAFFARVGYRLHRISIRDGAVNLEALLAPIGVMDDQDLSNYIALPKERCEAVLAALKAPRVQR